MALKLSLQSTGPGQGILHIAGPTDAPESVNLAIQRNDGRYLGLHGQWQPTPHWHPQFSAEPDPAGLRLALGPELVDGIIAMRGAPLQMAVRLDDRQDSGVLRIRGSLIGSDAAAIERTAIMKRGAGAAPPPAPEDATAAERYAGALSLDELEVDPIPNPTPPHRRAIWPWLLAVLLVLALGAGLAAWYLGWLDIPPEPPRTEAPPVMGVTTSPDSPLTGVAFASDFLAAGPSARAILAQADASARAGDCDAALLLYDQAAKRDASLAIEVARLFDPASFAEGGCIDAASEDNALEYYLAAADAGVPDAMRRAGDILSSRAASGPIHEQGVELLRRARQRQD